MLLQDNEHLIADKIVLMQALYKYFVESGTLPLKLFMTVLNIIDKCDIPDMCGYLGVYPFRIAGLFPLWYFTSKSQFSKAN